MKNSFCLLLCICLCKISLAQTDSSVLYYSFSNVPEFTIITIPDSAKFTKADLVKMKPSVIIFFNPDCEHCRKETEKLVANIDLLKRSKILMVSATEYNFNKKFYDDYKIADHPNIIIGREPVLSLGIYFKVHSIPSTFVYDKKGNFVKVFKGNIPVEEIAQVLNP